MRAWTFSLSLSRLAPAARDRWVGGVSSGLLAEQAPQRLEELLLEQQVGEEVAQPEAKPRDEGREHHPPQVLDEGGGLVALLQVVHVHRVSLCRKKELKLSRLSG